MGWAALNLLFNVVLPATWLMLVSRAVAWGALSEFAIGISFPFAFALMHAWRNRRLSFISVLAVASISLTAVVGFWAQERIWFALKGAVIPLLMATTIALFRPRVTAALRQLTLLGPFFRGEAIRERLSAHADGAARYEMVMVSCTRWLGAHFVFNAVLNAAMNWLIVTATPGTELFNEQYGELIARNVYLVALPCGISIGAIVFVSLKRIRRITGLTLRQMVRNPLSALAKAT